MKSVALCNGSYNKLKCNNIICCRKEDGFPDYPELKAGKYGSLARCDMPVAGMLKMAEKVRELNPDAIFWTGDIVPHDLWK